MSLILDGTGTISGLNAGGLPSATVTQATLATPVAGTGPAFSAWQSVQQTLPTTTLTKIQFQTEEFDTANCFDNTTNYRFTPNVAGYYQVSGGIQVGATPTAIAVYVYKNGTQFKTLYNSNTAGVSGAFGSALIYFNGSTDYVELYATVGSGQVLNNQTQFVYFQAAMVRSA